MADKFLRTRIQLKYDTLENWNKSSLILLAGEIAVTSVPATPTQVVDSIEAPQILFKVGDGAKTFAQLNWASGMAADVYEWAKTAKPGDAIALAEDGSGNAITGIKYTEDTNGHATITATKGETFATKAELDGLDGEITTNSCQVVSNVKIDKNKLSGAVKTIVGSGEVTVTESENTITVSAPAITVTPDVVTGDHLIADEVVVLTDISSQNHTITQTGVKVPTKQYVDNKVAGSVQYLGLATSLSDLSTTAGKGDFYRANWNDSDEITKEAIPNNGTTDDFENKIYFNTEKYNSYESFLPLIEAIPEIVSNNVSYILAGLKDNQLDTLIGFGCNTKANFVVIVLDKFSRPRSQVFLAAFAKDPGIFAEMGVPTEAQNKWNETIFTNENNSYQLSAGLSLADNRPDIPNIAVGQTNEALQDFAYIQKEVSGVSKGDLLVALQDNPAAAISYTGYAIVKSSDDYKGTVTSITVQGNNGLTGTGTVTESGTITLSHADTSSQANTNNSGRTYIQNVELDEYGHVTKLTSASETITHQDIKTLNTNNTIAQEINAAEEIKGNGVINLHKVSKTGSYNDLNDKPTIGDGIFTVTGGNGLTGSGSSTANQTGASSATLNVGAGTGITVNTDNVEVTDYINILSAKNANETATSAGNLVNENGDTILFYCGTSK